MLWKFKCPICGNVASTQDYKDAGAPVGAVAFSCIGRWTGNAESLRRAFGEKKKSTPPTPCDYTGGGLIGLNPVHVVDSKGQIIQSVFEFAPL